MFIRIRLLTIGCEVADSHLPSIVYTNYNLLPSTVKALYYVYLYILSLNERKYNMEIPLNNQEWTIFQWNLSNRLNGMG